MSIYMYIVYVSFTTPVYTYIQEHTRQYSMYFEEQYSMTEANRTESENTYYKSKVAKRIGQFICITANVSIHDEIHIVG